MGIEPTTSAVTGRRSNRLSHRAKSLQKQKLRSKNCTVIISYVSFLLRDTYVPSKLHTEPFIKLTSLPSLG